MDMIPEYSTSLTSVAQPSVRATPRGRLRIYFGASSGVDRTGAMLSGARSQHTAVCKVAVATHSAHGLADTSALLEGLAVLPPKIVMQGSVEHQELDLDAVLALRPALAVIDELAHSNADGALHPKRWQDVEELLAAGIDVFTTLGVHQLESLNDVVSGITGTRIAETVPDTVFDEADEVVLVDVPVDKLVARHAAAGMGGGTNDFFCRGNLLALRELAFRRIADRVEKDIQAYRTEESIKPIWQTNAALLACIGTEPQAGHVIRSAAQLAAQLNGGWHAIYVETPQLQRLPSERRQHILEQLKLAENLGATTAILTGNDIALAIAAYAREKNISRIAIGRSRRAWRFPWEAHFMADIAIHVPDADLIEISNTSVSGNASQFADAARPRPGESARAAASMPGPSRAKRYAIAGAASLLTALITMPLLPYFELANIAMLFLLTVVLVSVRFGREASVVATVVGVVALMLATPRFSFAVSDWQYTVTFLVMLAVGLITGSLTAGLQFQARIALHRETRSRALYEFARALSGALQTEQIFDITRSFIQRTFNARATLLLPDHAGRLQCPVPSRAANTPHMSVLDMGVAQWAFDRATPAGTGTDTLPNNSFFYLPLLAPMRTRGVLAIEPANGRWILIPEQRKQLDTFAALAAIALERVHYVEVAQDTQVHMESERLRNSLLAALSHDLRTPLTSLVGISESLAISKPALSPSQNELALALRDEAVRMNNLVSNLLDMARIQSGQVKLNLQWQTLEEVVGSALRASRWQLAGHEIQTRLGRDLPLVRFDAVLVERVLCNLLENAAKYTPGGSCIAIIAAVQGDSLEVTVQDNGPGLPAGQEEAIFEKFTRGERESPIAGVGLGLAICRAIVEAHGGAIRGANSKDHGASFIFTLPLGSPPEISAMEDNDSVDRHTILRAAP